MGKILDPGHDLAEINRLRSTDIARRQRMNLSEQKHFHILCKIYICGNLVWRRSLVIDTRLRDQKVPGSDPGCARLTSSPWERLFTGISSPHPRVKQIPEHYRQHARVTRNNSLTVMLPKELRKKQ